MNIRCISRITCSKVSLLFVLIATVVFATNGWAVDTGSREPRQHFFIQSFGDLPDELETARAESKTGMLLFFEAADCKYCQAMLKGVLSDREVQDFYGQHFLNIAIDIHGDVEIRDFDGITLPSKVFSSHRQVFITPVLSFLDLNGREIYRHLGMVKTKEEFLSIGEYIIDEHYLDTEYRVFAERQKPGKNGAAVTEHQRQD